MIALTTIEILNSKPIIAIAGAIIGFAIGILQSSLIEWNKEVREQIKKDRQFKQLIKQMPTLLGEFLTDVSDYPDARDFIILPDNTKVSPITHNMQLRYSQPLHPNIRGQIRILCNHQYIINYAPPDNFTYAEGTFTDSFVPMLHRFRKRINKAARKDSKQQKSN